MIDLTDKVSIVTGGASGIGRGICLALAGQGSVIVVADMNAEGAESVAAEVAELGRQSVAVAVDVTDRTSVSTMITLVLERFAKIDIAVNDAGVIGAPGWAERQIPDDTDWDHVLAVNLRGVVNVSEAVAAQMERRVEKHGGMAAREHEAVPVEPVGVAGVEAHDPGEKDIGRGRQRHRGARMSGIRLLDRIHRKRADGVDAKLVQGRSVQNAG